MGIIRRKVKGELFKNKTPIVFELERHSNKDTIRTENGRHWCSSMLEDRLNIGRQDDGWGRFGAINYYGLLTTSGGCGALAVAVRDSETDKISIYCREEYFTLHPTHKKYINKFAKDLGLSVRKDIHYIENDEIDLWVREVTVDMNFYLDETQDNVTEAVFAEIAAEQAEKQLVRQGVLTY